MPAWSYTALRKGNYDQTANVILRSFMNKIIGSMGQNSSNIKMSNLHSGTFHS